MILVPVKDLRGAKQRLASVLPQEQRTELAETMLADVLTAIAGWHQHPPAALVTSYTPAVELARRHGFAVIQDSENVSETAAIEMATRSALARGASETLVIPGDIPLVTSDELRDLYAAAPSRGVLLSPAYDGRGSNAVLRRPGDLIPLRFGNDSFIPHRQAAQATGKPVVVIDFPGIGLDIDTPADLVELLARPSRSRTQQLLAGWNVAERLSDKQHA